MVEEWDGSRIDILFVDLAKTADLNIRIIEQFYPALVPGESLLVHQDFNFCWLPYIHISMQYLAHRFVIIDRWVWDSSRIYMLKDKITPEEFKHIRSFSREERIDLLQAYVDGETGQSLAMARVTNP